jgi:hypothetical protein
MISEDVALISGSQVKDLSNNPQKHIFFLSRRDNGHKIFEGGLWDGGSDIHLPIVKLLDTMIY